MRQASSAPLNKRTIYSTIGYQLFMMHQVKKPLMEGVQTLTSPDANFAGKTKAVRKIWRAYQNFQKMPEPTAAEAWHPNARNILYLRDWFCEHCLIGGIRVHFVRTVFNFVAVLYLFDAPWRVMMDDVRAEAFKLKWEPKGYGDEPCKFDWWKDDD